MTRTGSIPRILGLLREELPALSAGTVLLVAGAGLSLVYPQGIRAIVDGAIAGREPSQVTRIALLLAALAVFQGAAIAGRALLFSLAGERGVRRVRERLYASLLSQEVGFFDASRTGELVSRLGTDCATLQSLLSAQISMIRALARRYQDALADASHVAEESLSAIRTVRAFVAEQAERARYGRAVADSYDAARKRAYAGSTFMGAAAAGGYAAMAAVLGYGGRLVAKGDMTAGALTAFLVYTLLIAMSLAALAEVWAEAMRGLGAADRVFELMDRKPEMPLTGGVIPEESRESPLTADRQRPLTLALSPGGGEGSKHGRITFEAVRFAYPTRPDAEVLSGLDLEIRSGEVVALVGASGAGKSTVASLVGRLYDPSAGRVLLDGRDLRELDPAWLRAQIGVVPQEPVLFSASIEENVRYGRPGASHADVVAACRAAHADTFVRAFPEGYATKVGERGQQLSGGQRQRIAIARAVLKDPRILLLDEATSALDSESEALVQDALEKLMIGRTAIVIAHRLSTVARADRVIVLEGGRVVEAGPHAALMDRGGPYRRLVEKQLLKASPAAV